MRAGLAIGLMLVAIIGVALAADEPSPGSTFTLERDDLMNTDNTLVVRLKIAAPPTDMANLTRLVFTYGPHPDATKELSTDMSAGIWPRKQNARVAEVLIVAQVCQGNSKHPPMLLLATQQSSGPKNSPTALTHQAHRLDTAQKMADVLTLDVKAGEYALGNRIRIGTLGVDPFYLSVEPDAAR